ncbi:MAG: hypothetical protein AAF330_00220 [Pseudomonadota bacterium]
MLRTLVFPLFVVALSAVASPALAQSSGEACEIEIELHTGPFCLTDVQEFLPPPDPGFVQGLEIFGCEAVPMAGLIMGNVMLYHAAQCEGEPVRLEGGMGAHSGRIDVWGGGLMPPEEGNSREVVRFVGAPGEDPTADMLRWVRESMTAYDYTASEIAACRPRRVPEISSDAWVVDDRDESAPGDAPRSSCGDYGYTEESAAYWRIAHGLAMFFDLGQDAYQDFDPTTLTIIEETNEGWRFFDPYDVAKDAAEDMSDDGQGQVQDIAGGRERAYAKVRGWTVSAARAADGTFLYCVAERPEAEVKFRFGYDGVQWQLAMTRDPRGWELEQFEVDGASWGITGYSDDAWSYGWIGLPELDAMREGQMMMIDIGKATFDLSLKGTAATILKIEECVAAFR